MESNIYPIRSFIRFQAKQQLLAETQAQTDVALSHESLSHEPSSVQRVASVGEAPKPAYFDITAVDNDLLKEIAATLFNSDRHPELYQPCKDIIEATAIEDAIAFDIVATYRQIKQNQKRTEVQALNKLLP